MLISDWSSDVCSSVLYVQGLTGVWLELEGLREMQGVETHAIGGCVHRRDCFEVFAGCHDDDVIRASGPVAAPIRPAWRVPISREKDGPSAVGPLSADGRLSMHVLERLQPRDPLPRARESAAQLTGLQKARCSG